MKEKQLKRLKRNCWLDICLDYLISCKKAFKDYLNDCDLQEYSKNSFMAIETYFNLNFNRMEYDKKYKCFEKIIFDFLHLIFAQCSNEDYQLLFSKVQKVKSNITYKEYVLFCQSMLKSFEQSQLLLPIFMFFDSVYSEEMILGSSCKYSPVKCKIYNDYLGFNLNKLESFLLTADNMQQKETMCELPPPRFAVQIMLQGGTFCFIDTA